MSKRTAIATLLIAILAELEFLVTQAISVVSGFWKALYGKKTWP